MVPATLVSALSATQPSGPAWWSFVTDNSSALSALALLATTVILFLAALIAWRQVKEARRLREEQTRPFVVVDFDVTQHSQFIYVTVSNIGRTMAENVRIAFEPQLWSSLDERPNMTKAADIGFFKEGIPSLPPSKVISVAFDFWIGRAKTPGKDRYLVTVHYQSPQRRKKYRDQMVLDLTPYLNLLNVRAKTLDDVHRELEQIRKTVEEFGTRGRGLLVKTPADLQAERKEIEEQVKVWQNEEEAAKASAQELSPSGGTNER